MLRTGAVFDRYRIQSVIAGGGMGVVYRAEHTRVGRTAAIKVLQPHLAARPSVRARFEQEARIQADLQHPNIVRVDDFIVEGDVLAIAMEFIDGPTLQDVLDQSADPWAVDDALAILLPVADAIAFAHARGVVHRDLKPANVLLDRANPGGHVLGTPCVSDFGIARILGSEARMTQEGMRIGTAPYMSPEQYAGRLDAGPEADVFALGVLAWRMLTGALPVDPNDMSALHEFYAGAVALPPLRSVAPGVPPEVAAAVDRALIVDPAHRTPSVRAFVDALYAGPGGGATARTVLETPAPADATPTLAANPPTSDRGPVSAAPPALTPVPASSTAQTVLESTAAWESTEDPALTATATERAQRMWLMLAIIGLFSVGLGAILAAALSGPSGCGSDRDCRGDRICEAGTCTDPAPPAAQRPATTTREEAAHTTRNAAQPPEPTEPTEPTAEQCTASSQCSGDLVCIRGTCNPLPSGCERSADCPPELACDYGQCREPIHYPACRRDSGCDAGERCVNGTCATVHPRRSAQPPPRGSGRVFVHIARESQRPMVERWQAQAGDRYGRINIENTGSESPNASQVRYFQPVDAATAATIALELRAASNGAESFDVRDLNARYGTQVSAGRLEVWVGQRYHP